MLPLCFHAAFALGAWGGENLAPANSRDFKLKTMNSFPTMGYAFNRTMWNTIVRLHCLLTVTMLRGLTTGAFWSARRFS